MKQKQLFIDALSTMYHSWGSDTPVECCWAMTELLTWYEMEYGVDLGVKVVETYQPGYEGNFDAIIEAIKNS